MNGIARAWQPADDLPRGVRWAALGSVVVCVGVGLAIRLPDYPLLSVAAAAVSIAGAALLLRPRPGLVVLYAMVATAGLPVLGKGTSSSVAWFTVCILLAWCVLASGPRDGLIYWGVLLVLFGAEWLAVPEEPGWPVWMVASTFILAGSLSARHQLDLVARLRAAQAGLAERARVEERNRIARDLHDVIAHTLTVSLMHVTSARLAVEYEPADAARALAEAERLGRQSLTEVRNVVGMLRENGAGGSAAPLPGVADLPALVERFRAAGADVSYRVDGDPAVLPATTGLAVYRIAQEALTNVAKHALGAPVGIDLSVSESSVTLAVDSAGKPGRGSGLGLAGMRERAESLGGTCQAGPGGSGWLVSATLPLSAGRTPEAAT